MHERELEWVESVEWVELMGMRAGVLNAGGGALMSAASRHRFLGAPSGSSGRRSTQP